MRALRLTAERRLLGKFVRDRDDLVIRSEAVVVLQIGPTGWAQAARRGARHLCAFWGSREEDAAGTRSEISRTMALSRGHARERVSATEFVTVGFNALFGLLFLPCSAAEAGDSGASVGKWTAARHRRSRSRDGGAPDHFPTATWTIAPSNGTRSLRASSRRDAR